MPTNVSGSIKSLAEAAVGSANNAVLRFVLQGTGQSQPTIVGTAILAPFSGNNQFYVDLPADANGNVSGTIYSTRAADGVAGGDISVSGSTTAVYYDMMVVAGGVSGPRQSIHAKNGATLDPSSVTPITTLPVVSAPTGDGTYAQLTGGNTPFTGFIQFNAGFSGNAKKLNGVRFADQFAGANGGAQINSALSDLGSSAGRIQAVEGLTFGGFNAPANNQSIWDFRQTQDILNNAPPGTLATRPTVLTINQNLGEFSTAALTGTVTLTNGSTAVTGVGTKFTTEINPAYFFGPSIRLSADGVTKWAEVASVTDDTHATLKANYAGTGGSGAAVILVGQEGLCIRATSTAGTPNTYSAGEWVGLSVFGVRSGGKRGIYGANLNLTYATSVDSNQGQCFGLEIDITNNSGVDAPLTGSLGIDLNAVGANRCGTAINIGGQWSNGMILSGWGSVGLYLQGSSNHMQFTPTVDNASVQLQGFNANQSATTWKINNDGSALFSKNVNFTNSPLPITCSSTSGAQQIRLDVVSGNFAGIQYTNTGNQRWLVGKNGTAESGSNVGSDFDFDRYNDAGTFQDTPLSINRATGLITVADGITISNGLTANTAKLTAAAPTVSASQVGLGSTTATSATAGANGAVPAQVAGYLIINVAGTAQKVPYFNS